MLIATESDDDEERDGSAGSRAAAAFRLSDSSCSLLRRITSYDIISSPTAQMSTKDAHDVSTDSMLCSGQIQALVLLMASCNTAMMRNATLRIGSV